MNISLCIIFHAVTIDSFTKTWSLRIFSAKWIPFTQTLMRSCETLCLMNSVRQAVVTEVASISVSDPLSSTRLVPDDPEFGLPIVNLTTPVGREAVLSCTVDHLGKYKVSNTSPLTPLIPVLHVESWLVTSFSSVRISRNKFITKELSLHTVRWPRNCNTVL